MASKLYYLELTEGTMDLPLVIKQRLKELGLEQKDLAAAAEVTDSYISQLLARKKTPPASRRTDIYEKIGDFLRLPAGELVRLAELQRHEVLKKKVEDPPRPLFRECRQLVLRKCDPGNRKEIQAIFEKDPFGELERLVTQKLLDVTQKVAKEQQSEKWLGQMAKLNQLTYEQMRVAILDFLDADVFDISVENCVSFLDPLIESWSMDLKTFSLEIVLNRRLAPGRLTRFEFLERKPEPQSLPEPGLEEFLKDGLLSDDATKSEIEFLRSLKFKDRRPTPMYYYRELQNLRDALHFRSATP
jgi:transcriptional regulator with XRE-family HTH domain